MVLAQLTALAQGLVLVAGLTLSAGPASPGSGPVVARPASTAISVALAPVDQGPAPRVASLSDWAQDLHPVALECEDPEVESFDGRHEPEDASPSTAPSIAGTPPHARGALLYGRDAVASHSARGPPAA